MEKFWQIFITNTCKRTFSLFDSFYLSTHEPIASNFESMPSFPIFIEISFLSYTLPSGPHLLSTLQLISSVTTSDLFCFICVSSTRLFSISYLSAVVIKELPFHLRYIPPCIFYNVNLMRAVRIVEVLRISSA